MDARCSGARDEWQKKAGTFRGGDSRLRWKESVIVIIAVSNLIVIVIPQLSKVLCQFSSGGYDAA